MREILFRGKKTISGEWVEGGYYENDTGKYVITPAFVAHLVDPETVGQYTGLTDKNGRKIFEGDILRGQYDEDNPEDYTFLEAVWNNGWRITQGRGDYDFLEEFDCQRCEVIGNIYDNPSCWKA